MTDLGRVRFSGEIGLLDSYYQSSRQIFFGSGKPSWPPRGPRHPSAVQLPASKGRDMCQISLDFVLTRKRACPPKGYTYPVILKQQHERENIVAFASICGPSNPLPASRHCERDSLAAACSGILFSLLKRVCPSRTCESKFCLTGTVNIRLNFAQKEAIRIKLYTSTRQTCVLAHKWVCPFASLRYRFKLK